MPVLKNRRKIASKEQVITEALNDYHAGKFSSVSAAARHYSISIYVLNRRLKGVKSKSESHAGQQLLTLEQEEAIVRLCLKLDGWGNPLKLQYVHTLATHLQPDHKSPGKHWISRFLDRHPVLASKIATRIDRQRATADNPKVLAYFFQLLGKIIKDFEIKSHNIWNIDEKGFMRGAAHKCRVITRRGRKNPRLLQDGEREIITVIEGVSAGGALLQPMIIYKGKAHTTGWYTHVSEKEPAVFAYSDKGWTDNELGVEYLRQVFEPGTASIAAGDTRLLILDGHSSHTSAEFLLYALDHNIIILCLPSHTSHILQPLDVGLFAQLQRYYSDELDDWTSHGLCSIQKSEFFKLFVTARKRTYTSTTIKNAFAATGIWPLNPRKVLDVPQRRLATSNEGSSSIASPLTPIGGRQAGRLGRELQEPVNKSSLARPESQLLNSGISKLTKFAVQTAADLEVEVFRHQQLRKQVGNKVSKASVDRRVLTRARVITHKDVLRLKNERDAKCKARVTKATKCNKRRKQVTRDISYESSVSSDGSGDSKTLESNSVVFGGTDEIDIEDCIVVGGGK